MPEDFLRDDAEVASAQEDPPTLRAIADLFDPPWRETVFTEGSFVLRRQTRAATGGEVWYACRVTAHCEDSVHLTWLGFYPKCGFKKEQVNPTELYPLTEGFLGFLRSNNKVYTDHAGILDDNLQAMLAEYESSVSLFMPDDKHSKPSLPWSHPPPGRPWERWLKPWDIPVPPHPMLLGAAWNPAETEDPEGVRECEFEHFSKRVTQHGSRVDVIAFRQGDATSVREKRISMQFLAGCLMRICESKEGKIYYVNIAFQGLGQITMPTTLIAPTGAKSRAPTIDLQEYAAFFASLAEMVQLRPDIIIDTMNGGELSFNYETISPAHLLFAKQQADKFSNALVKLFGHGLRYGFSERFPKKVHQMFSVPSQFPFASLSDWALMCHETAKSFRETWEHPYPERKINSSTDLLDILLTYIAPKKLVGATAGGAAIAGGGGGATRRVGGSGDAAASAPAPKAAPTDRRKTTVAAAAKAIANLEAQGAGASATAKGKGLPKKKVKTNVHFYSRNRFRAHGSVLTTSKKGEESWTPNLSLTRGPKYPGGDKGE